MHYQVNEIFTSLQGEGTFTGMLSTFIRLQGCPVGCEWCDSGPLADLVEGRMTNGNTRNTWGKGGTKMSVSEIVEQIQARHVVITGGEPTIWNLDELLEAMPAHTTTQLETSGLRNLIGKLRPTYITVSPKERLKFEVAPQLLKYATELKFVVELHTQAETIYDLLAQAMMLDNEPSVRLMPEGCPPKPECIARCMELIRINPKWRFTDRLQYRLGIQ